jgi:hypothetical protein
MKNKIKTVFPLLLYVLLASTGCNKLAVKVAPKSLTDETNQLRRLAFTLTDTPNVYCYVLVDLNLHVDNPGDSTFKISAGGAFTDSATGNRLRMTSVAINSRVLTPGPDSSFDFSYTDSSGTAPAEGEALAGTNVVIKITGTTSADTVSQSIYMPKNVLRQRTDWPTTYFNGVDIKDNLSLNWIADSSTDTKDVYIQLVYDPILSQMANPSNPSSINDLTYVEYDNGAYTISKTDLSNTYSASYYIQIGLGRGTQRAVVLPVSHRQVIIWTINSLVTTPLQVSDQ